MSHVIPQTILQTLKSGRCNSNVFRAYRKLTEGNYVRVFWKERLPPAREIAAHPHGSPKMSHVIPRTILQTLKSGRCNSNVFRAYQKLTKINYVRVFGEKRLPPAGAGPTSAHHAPAARRARTPTASHSHPHGSPQMSHVIPRHVFQTLKLGRCNSNVFRAYRKLTEGNYVRLLEESTRQRTRCDRAVSPHPGAAPNLVLAPPTIPVRSRLKPCMACA